MLFEESHLTDHELLLAADGELTPTRTAHLSGCWSCRVRKQEIDNAIGEFVRFHRDTLDPLLPSPAGPRALLKARLAEMAAASPPWWAWWPRMFAWRYGAAALLLAGALALSFRYWMPVLGFQAAARTVPVSFPEPSLTPGAVVTASREQVCKSEEPKNRAVPASLKRKVFEEYGIPNAEARAYEVDYLITPALGGADDIRNLWPQSYSSAVWNARVKDALEDRLRDLVCENNLDLVAAQRELSSDWIAAYRKYFHTDQPLESAP